MAGKICTVQEGKFKDMLATVENKQQPEIIKAGKVNAFLYHVDMTPYVTDGKHKSTLIDPKKLAVTGFYD